MDNKISDVYNAIRLHDAEDAIRININNATKSFVVIGFYLKCIRDKKLYLENGYSNVWELAQAEFGISKPQASKFMNINDKFSVDGNSPILLEQYKDFSSSKLSEMLYLTDEQLEQVTLATTRAEIRDMKKPAIEDKVVSHAKHEPESEKVAPAHMDPEPEKVSTSKLEPEPEEQKPIDFQTRNTIIRAFVDSFTDLKKENIHKEFQRPVGAEKRIDYLKSCMAWGGAQITLDGQVKKLYLRKAGENELELSDWYHNYEEFLPGVKIFTFTFDELALVTTKMLYEIDYPNPEKPKLCKWDGKSNCAAICDTGAECCAECERHGSCNSECGWQDKRIPKPSGNCLHRPGFPCTLPEASKLAQGDGVDCNAKCCWGCPKHDNCGYECNSSAQRPVEVKQELQYFDKLAAYWCKREMTVELYELAKSKEKEDIDVFNRYFKEKYTLGECYAPAHNTPGYEISFRTDKSGIHFDDKEKTGYSWPLLIELVCQEAENETLASKPCNVHENPGGLKRLKEIRKEVRVRNQQPESVSDAVDTSEKVCSNCNYNNMDPDKYREEHPDTDSFPCNDCDDKLNHWIPKVHIIVKPEEDSRIHRPDLRGLMQDPYCRVCGAELEYKHDCKCGNKIDWSGLEDIFKFEEEQLKLKPEQEKVETVEADIVQTVPAKEYDFDKVSMYDLTDIKLSIIDHQHDLASYKDCELDAPIVKREKMEMDALQCLEESLYMHDMPDPDSKPEPVQPELPILKNNDQRKEWAENYKAWGEWYYDEHIDCHYYKYDFHNGDKLIVEEYRGMKRYWNKNEEYDQVHYHLCLKQKTDQWIKTPHEQRYEHSTTSMTEIVDYLKDFQKNGV